MQENYSKQAKEAIRLAKLAAKEMKHPYVGTEHLLIGLKKIYTGVAAQVLAQNNVNDLAIMAVINDLVYNDKPDWEVIADISPRLSRLFKAAEHEAYISNSALVGTEHLLLALIKESDCVGCKVLTTMEVDINKVYSDTILGIGGDAQEAENMHPVDVEEFLSTYTRDLTKLAKEGRLDPVVGRDAEIKRLMEIVIRRSKNNPCLVGEPGIGKTAIVEGLAIKIIEETVPTIIRNKRILSLDLPSMIAGTKYRGEFEERMKLLIQEVENDPDILLFMDEVHTIIGAGGSEGSVDAANMLKPALSRGRVQLIGATTIAEYRKYIEKDTALERRFQPIHVEEPTPEQCLEILEGIKNRYQSHHNVIIEEGVLPKIVEMSKRYITDRFLPDKAIDILDEACAKVNLSTYKEPVAMNKLEEQYMQLTEAVEKAVIQGEIEKAAILKKEEEQISQKLDATIKRHNKKYTNQSQRVSLEQVTEVVAEWTQIPITKLEETEVAKLRRLEQTLEKRVVGQKEAITTVTRAIKRGRVGLKDPTRPVGSFLFLGPTGVGKTELTKAITEVLFGTEDSLIRIDMSEYMEKHSVSKMIGSPPGYVGHGESGQLTDKVRSNPYSVVLFDEIEKAHPDVFNVLLQVLDDGHITDAKGRKVDFKNTIIIMTSNVGAQSIVEPKELGFVTVDDTQKKYERMQSKVMAEVKQLFRPEFINRIDDIIVFHMLDKEDMKKIVNLLVSQFIKRVKNNLNIHLMVRPSVKNLILEKGTDAKYGARPLRRALQQELEDALAEAILEGKVSSGDTITAGTNSGVVEFHS